MYILLYVHVSLHNILCSWLGLLRLQCKHHPVWYCCIYGISNKVVNCDVQAWIIPYNHYWLFDLEMIDLFRSVIQLITMHPSATIVDSNIVGSLGWSHCHYSMAHCVCYASYVLSIYFLAFAQSRREGFNFIVMLAQRGLVEWCIMNYDELSDLYVFLLNITMHPHRPSRFPQVIESRSRVDTCKTNRSKESVI